MPPKKATQAKSKSKAPKKTKDEEIEEEEEEEEIKTTKRTTRQSASAKKQPSKGKKKDEEEDEDEEEESPKKTTKRGASKKAPPKKPAKKGKKDEEEEDEEEEEEKPKAKRGAAKSASTKKPAKKGKKDEEEDDGEEEEDEKPAAKRSTRSTRSQSAKEPKKAEPKKASPAKKPASKAAAKATTKQAAKDKKAADDDEKESEDEAPAQTTPAPKKEPAKKAPAKKKAAKKRDSGYSPWTDKSNKSYYNNRYGYGSYGYGGYNRYNKDDDDDFISDDEGKGRGRKGGRPKSDPNKDIDTDANIALDPEVVITNNIRVLALKGKPAYDYYDEEEDKSDPSVKKFFHMQILDNYQSTFPTHFFTFYRWGKAGEVGEWSLRGFFNRSRAIKIYDDKVEERKKYAKFADKKDTQNSQDQSQKDNAQPSQTTAADTQVSQPAAEVTQTIQEEQKNGTQSTEKKNDGIMEVEKQEEKKDAAEPVADQTMEVEKPAAATTTTTTAEQTDTQTMEVEKQGEQAESKEQPKEAEKPASQKLDVNRIECPVDKYCVLKDEAEVLIKDDEIFDVKYNVSDIQKNSNHFYCFQLLRNKKDPSRHYIFTRYGRVGLGGEWTLRGPFNEEQGIAAYRVKQNEKKEQNKYTALEMSYTKDDPEILTKAFQEAVGKSKLDKKVAEFIQLIFDFKMMNNQMAQAGYDTKKLPLGKLSLNMIEKGFSKLSELSEAIKNHAGEDVLAKLSSEFYTVIPQNIGWQNMKTMTIRENRVITEKLEFLDSLRQIQIAYQMVYGLDQEANPIDTNYEKLKCDIEPLDQNSDEYKKIKEYIDNTKESYNVEIMEAFKINKHGAEEVFKKDLSNHVMLWHGSRLTNFVGILSQGLRIAPPEAPVSGYRLGKGIYLADMISKSVPYCYASGSNNTFCIMVCESALGNFNEKLRDDFYASNLPADKHSTKALGHIAPPLSSYQDFAENVKIPLGKPEKTEHQSSAFMHNEYIVYDVNQVQIRYLLKMKQTYRGLFG